VISEGEFRENWGRVFSRCTESRCVRAYDHGRGCVNGEGEVVASFARCPDCNSLRGEMNRDEAGRLYYRCECGMIWYKYGGGNVKG
jgi:hypothetical protein